MKLSLALITFVSRACAEEGPWWNGMAGPGYPFGNDTLVRITRTECGDSTCCTNKHECRYGTTGMAEATACWEALDIGCPVIIRKTYSIPPPDVCHFTNNPVSSLYWAFPRGSELRNALFLGDIVFDNPRTFPILPRSGCDIQWFLVPEAANCSYLPPETPPRPELYHAVNARYETPIAQELNGGRRWRLFIPPFRFNQVNGTLGIWGICGNTLNETVVEFEVEQVVPKFAGAARLLVGSSIAIAMLTSFLV